MTKKEECEDCEPTEKEPSLRSITKETIAVFFSSKEKQALEREMFKLAVWTFLGLLVLSGIGYWGFFSKSTGFLEKFGFPLLYLLIGQTAVSSALWHMKCHRNVPHSAGMMIGMTIGMMAGFLVGMIVGATNGMFVGSIAGLLVGVVVGSWAGKCCGIMGVLEGQMAGFMAGPMGAMISVMLIADHLNWFLPIGLVFIVFILASLVYYLHREASASVLQVLHKKAREDFFVFLFLNFVVFLALAWLVIYGPKSALFLS
jgi:hypothetical protein